MADITFSKREHPLYSDTANLWELYDAGSKGGEEFITEDNLFSHRLEDAADFEARLERAYFLNLCSLLPTTYNNYIFKTSVERSPNEALDVFRKNTDGRNTPISSFVRRAGYFASVFGVIHALVDMPTAPKTNKLSKAEAKKYSLYPYTTLIYPSQLKDWSVDEYGNFRWVIIESTHYNDLDPKKDREDQLHYKLITTEEWEIQDADGNKVKFDDERESAGPNTLGMVPMITMYHGDNYGDNKIGESLLKDIVYINREVMNFCSLISESISRQAFSQLVVPDSGSLADAAESGTANPLLTLGTASIWTYDADSRTAPQYISPDAEILSVVWKHTVDLVKECFRLANLTGGTSDLYASNSGRQSQMSFMGVNAALSDKSLGYEKFENNLSKLALLQLGEEFDEYEEVKYPTNFDIAALEDELDSYFGIMERNFSSILNKTLQKSIARRVLPTTPQTTRTEIENEIDSGDGIVDVPASKKEEVPFDDGSGTTKTTIGQTFKTNEEKTNEEVKKKAKE